MYAVTACAPADMSGTCVSLCLALKAQGAVFQQVISCPNCRVAGLPVSCVYRLYPGLLQHVACAHIATAVTQERVSAAETALAVLRAGATTCEALLLQSVAHVLLGDFQAASAAIKASSRWGGGQGAAVHTLPCDASAADGLDQLLRVCRAACSRMQAVVAVLQGPC